MEDSEFSEFAAARWKDLVRSAVFLGSAAPDAQDIAQTTLLRCFVSWSAVSRADDRDAYLYKMLLNCLRDSRRRFWSREKPTERLPDEPSADPTTGVDIADAVHRALAALSPANRAAVVLRHLVGLSEQQTAQVLDIPVGTVKSRAARGLAQLASDAHLSDLAGGGVQ